MTPMLKDFFGDVSDPEAKQQMLSIGASTRVLDPSDVARSIVWLLSEASLDVFGINLPVGAR